MTKAKRDIYQEVTDSIIEQLESGSAPWLKPWVNKGRGSAATALMPHNATNGRAYSGVNVLLLWIAAHKNGYQSNGWITFNHMRKLGGNLKALPDGQRHKGTLVTFFKKWSVKDTDATTGEESNKTIPLLRHFVVFNLDQIENLPEESIYRAPEQNVEPAEGGNALLFATDVGCNVIHGGDRACYVPKVDQVLMPEIDQFDNVDAYSATLLHELTHWTGHKSRMARDLSGRFGSDAYAAEELTAEMGSAFLCAQLGVELRGLQHANYLATWIKILKADKKAIFAASSQARQASEWLVNRVGETATSVAA